MWALEGNGLLLTVGCFFLCRRVLWWWLVLVYRLVVWWRRSSELYRWFRRWLSGKVAIFGSWIMAIYRSSVWSLFRWGRSRNFGQNRCWGTWLARIGLGSGKTFLRGICQSQWRSPPKWKKIQKHSWRIFFYSHDPDPPWNHFKRCIKFQPIESEK